MIARQREENQKRTKHGFGKLILNPQEENPLFIYIYIILYCIMCVFRVKKYQSSKSKRVLFVWGTINTQITSRQLPPLPFFLA